MTTLSIALKGADATMKMVLTMEERSPLQCGDCLADVVTKIAPSEAAWVCCPVCGQEGTLTHALKEAAEYILHQTLGGIFEGLKTTGALKVRPSDRRYRFVCCD